MSAGLHPAAFISIAVALIAMPLRVALAQTLPVEDPVRLQVDDEVTKFVRFYREATASPLSADERWVIWQRDYGLAAVPPTPFGQTLARKQLDAVWDRYAPLIPKLPALTAHAQSLGTPTLRSIGALFGDDAEVPTVKLILFVGQFDNNAFAGAIDHDVPTVYLPVEMTDPDVALAHELAHAVHRQIGHLANGYLAPIGETLVMEGIAMRAAQQVRPGHDDAAYTPATVYGAAWLKTCEAKAGAILQGIAPYLDATDAQSIAKFTYGKGTTGLNDELYCAGWVLVHHLLTHEFTFRQLVRVPEGELPAFARKTITNGLGRPRP
jgi:hypothetical protein